MRLVITLAGVELEFVEPSADGAFPWLTEVGNLWLSAIAGHLEGTGVSETPNIPVRIDNRAKQATRLLGFPLRAPAVLYDSDGEEFFSGLVATVKYGRTLDLSIEA